MCEHQIPGGQDGTTVPAYSSIAFPIGEASAQPALSPSHLPEIALALGDRITRLRLMAADASTPERAVLNAKIAETQDTLSALPEWARAGVGEYVTASIAADEQNGRRVSVRITERTWQFLRAFCAAFPHTTPEAAISCLAEEAAMQSEDMQGTAPLSLREFHANLAESAAEHRAVIEGGAR